MKKRMMTILVAAVLLISLLPLPVSAVENMVGDGQSDLDIASGYGTQLSSTGEESNQESDEAITIIELQQPIVFDNVISHGSNVYINSNFDVIVQNLSAFGSVTVTSNGTIRVEKLTAGTTITLRAANGVYIGDTFYAGNGAVTITTTSSGSKVEFNTLSAGVADAEFDVEINSAGSVKFAEINDARNTSIAAAGSVNIGAINADGNVENQNTAAFDATNIGTVDTEGIVTVIVGSDLNVNNSLSGKKVRIQGNFNNRSRVYLNSVSGDDIIVRTYDLELGQLTVENLVDVLVMQQYKVK